MFFIHASVMLPESATMRWKVRVPGGVGSELTDTVTVCMTEPPDPEQNREYVLLAVRVPVDSDPLVSLVPDHAPEAVQLVALTVDQASVLAEPLLIVAGVAVSCRVGAGDVTVTVTDLATVPPAPEQLSE